MDELEILKRDWKKKENNFDQVSEKEIHAMLHKKSSSIVKWILIISIFEFVLLRVLDISSFFDEANVLLMKQNHLYDFNLILTFFNLVVFSVFIYLFYKNFKAINVISSVKQLMTNILKTRKIVTYYIWYNLALISITAFFVLTSFFKYNSEINTLYEKFPYVFVIGSIAVIGFILALAWLFYKLVYGILLKRLNNNYKELKKLDF